MNGAAYNALLEKALKEIPKDLTSKERFELPRINSNIQGSRTVIKDFVKVVNDLRRDPQKTAKILAQNLGTNFTVQGNDIALKGKFSGIEIQKIFQDFVKEFILCKECSRPDTKIMDRAGVKVLKCDACGAIMPVKEKI